MARPVSVLTVPTLFRPLAIDLTDLFLNYMVFYSRTAIAKLVLGI